MKIKELLSLKVYPFTLKRVVDSVSDRFLEPEIENIFRILSVCARWC